MERSGPSHHQMVRALRALEPSMEELARKSGIPVKRLWDAFNEADTVFRTWRRPLESYYYKLFPDFHFSAFFQKRDRKLQDAFQMAIKAEKGRSDRSLLTELFEDDWPWLCDWNYPRNRAAEHYLRGRYALISGWTGVPLDPRTDRKAALELAVSESVLSLAELDHDAEQQIQTALRMKVVKLMVSAKQRLHLLRHEKHLPLSLALERSELESLLAFLLSEITQWSHGHFNRWQWSRDAVTIASALNWQAQCETAFRILVEERPDFANPDHQEWTVGNAADDPALDFFRTYFDELCPH